MTSYADRGSRFEETHSYRLLDISGQRDFAQFTKTPASYSRKRRPTGPRSYSFLALVMILAFSVSTQSVRAQSDAAEVRGLEFAAAVNLPKKNVKVDGSIFLPQKATRLRSVIVIINWGLGPDLYDNPQWLKLAETLESGLLLARISNIGPPSSNIPQEVVRNAARGGADGLTRLLQRLAVESRHRELERAPILLWGHSAAGSFAASFAEVEPQRTLGFVRYHSHRRGLPLDMKLLSQVPALIVAGGKDATAGVEDSENLWKSGRSLGAPWTFAVEPDATHGTDKSLDEANALVIPWITAIFALRLSPSGTSLRVVTDQTGWMGNNRTGEVAPYDTFSASSPDISQQSLKEAGFSVVTNDTATWDQVSGHSEALVGLWG